MARQSPQKTKRSPLSYTVPIVFAVMMLLAVTLTRTDLRESTWFEITVGVLIAVAILVGVAVALYRSHARARAAAPPHGWGGRASFSVASMAASPTLREVAPHGPLSRMILSSGKVSGRLVVGDDVHFVPGTLEKLVGAQPFRASPDQIRTIGVKDGILTLHLRGDPSPVDARVVQGRGLAAASARLTRRTGR